jgi:hypothetical protein
MCSVAHYCTFVERQRLIVATRRRRWEGRPVSVSVHEFTGEDPLVAAPWRRASRSPYGYCVEDIDDLVDDLTDD